jgi:RNA polymerase sigma-B factor
LTQARTSGQPGPIKAAEHEVINTHLSLATALARRYQHRGVEFDDLQQLARLGLLKAVKRWQPEIGVDFLPFAYPTILGEVKRYFRDHGTTIRVPRGLRDRHTEVQSVTEELEQRLGHAANESELAEAAGIGVDQVQAGRLAVQSCKVLSLDELSIQAAAALRPSSLAETDLQRVEDLMMVRQAMAQLTDRERTILRLRYFEGLSQLKIGEAIGVSQMQVSRLVRGVLAKLRACLEECGEDLEPRMAS